MIKEFSKLNLNFLYRIKEGSIKEYYEYSRLLKWIKKFRDLGIRMVSHTLTNFPLDTLSNLDTIYEAWIFFEITNLVAQQYVESSTGLHVRMMGRLLLMRKT